MDSLTKDDRDNNRTVLITDIPFKLDEEDLELYLTNPRIGGGEINTSYLDVTNRTAWITFVASEGMIILLT